MSLSITCPCGARLEIDEAFAGQVIPCPDCNTPLPVAAPPAATHPRVSGLALASVALGSAGFCTVVGSVAAAVLGFRAEGDIRRDPDRLTGLRFARAGQILGVAGTLLTLLALVSPWTFGLDALLREFYWAGKLDYSLAKDGPALIKRGSIHSEVQFRIPSPAWGVVQESPNLAEAGDNILLVNVRDDAQIGVRTVGLNGDESDEQCREKGLEEFYKSQLVNLVGRLRGKPVSDRGTVREGKRPVGQGKQDLLVDLRLGGVDRTFLVRVQKDVTRLSVLMAGARRGDFPALEEEFLQLFESYKVEQ